MGLGLRTGNTGDGKKARERRREDGESGRPVRPAEREGVMNGERGDSPEAKMISSRGGAGQVSLCATSMDSTEARRDQGSQRHASVFRGTGNTFSGVSFNDNEYIYNCKGVTVRVHGRETIGTALIRFPVGWKGLTALISHMGTE